MDVFNRQENKYLIRDTELFLKLQDRLSRFTAADGEHTRGAVYKITNIYYDTGDSYLIRASLAKPAYKEKLRVRAYGVPDASSKVYVELKKKAEGIVNKRRAAMTLTEAYDFLETGAAPKPATYINALVLSEIETMLKRYPVKPALYLSYDRVAFGETADDGFRVTFDTNITTRRTDLRLENGSYGEKLLPDGVSLMEIKVRHNMPLWLSRLLGECKIYPASFSKYGAEYKRALAKQEEKTLFVLPTAICGIRGGITADEGVYAERTGVYA